MNIKVIKTTRKTIQWPENKGLVKYDKCQIRKPEKNIHFDVVLGLIPFNSVR